MNVERMEKPQKPLGRKAYGSIAHLPNSRMGPSDSHCHEGQARICMEKARDKYDRVIVTEKLDGSNVAVARVGGELFPLGRSGYPAITSPHEQHIMFHNWALERKDVFMSMLDDGCAIHGEWLAQAHGTIYNLYHAPFVAFDLTVDGKRTVYDELYARCQKHDIVTPRVISDGGPCGMETVLPAIEYSGHGVSDQDSVEGAVWRVERKGVVDFLAKWVRSDKIDGKYFTQISGEELIWNWRND